MKILITDDDEFIVEVMQAFLVMEGHDIKVAHDGQMGLELCAQYPFDLAIVDLFMPVKDGFEMMSDMKIKFPHIKVLAISGMCSSDSAYAQQALDSGANRILLKPFALNSLSETIAEIMATP